ncbi:MAG: 4Fe-4S binding protein [Myxococcota bacterium]
MFHALKTRWEQGRQYVPDVRTASPAGFRGLPILDEKRCPPDCHACTESCPTQAITAAPLTLDLGRCVFCADCVDACPQGAVDFSAGVRMAARTREDLVLKPGHAAPHVPEDDAIRKVFGRSLRLRSVSAGGCNGCELEINAMANVNFDVGRYGIEFAASPRHADALILSGPIPRNMARALELTWEGMPAPRFVIAAGACAISGGVFAPSGELERGFLGRNAPDLYLPGCPPHPLTMINGILDLLGREKRS